MLKLGYRIKDEESAAPQRLLGADAGALHYNLVLGDIEFELDDCSFSAAWGWIPLLDFANAMRQIDQRLKAGSNVEVFEFTESEAQLTFQRADDQLEVRASYVPCRGRTSLRDFSAAVRSLWETLIKDLLSRCPDLQTNAAFREVIGGADGSLLA